ncbi:FAD binding domain-containing protein [Patellaria atrata CBS 101060]|uniref:FAD binding domain-containing protein n=1 Tax=Patellaria atrata CBS 101060 TaxID=1346257 RepID=A0A9P4VPV6_9PEZI|nr:FAD binding domain-containing protein [Patellaria atrata CBS 101060]
MGVFGAVGILVLALISSQSQASPTTPWIEKGSLIARAADCKCAPGDRCWPAVGQWKALDRAVGGRLEKVIPPPAVCFKSFEGKPTYNAAACEKLKTDWLSQQWHTDQQVDNMWNYYANTTCIPPGNPNEPCLLGNYPAYVIMATTKEHIKAGVDFARKNNIRLLIRNTGHDFMGRASGYGSLAINTHSFQEATWHKQYSGPGNYRGKAVTLGAGVQGREIYGRANAQSPPQVIVGGECPTVGLAGGYIQGGGHGPMATYHGMAADQALSFDVVTADGRYVTANAEENQDLFWALKGGGPGTYGVVVSVTVKTFDELPTAGLQLDLAAGQDSELFWKAVAYFHNRAPYWVDNGMFVYYELGDGFLHIAPFVGPNMNMAKIKRVIKPLIDDLDAAGVGYTTRWEEYPSFYQLYIKMFEDEGTGVNAITGGRLFTRSDVENRGNEIIEAYKLTVKNTPVIIGHIVGPGHGMPKADNPTHPAWRDAVSFSIATIPVEINATVAEKAAAQNIITNVTGPALRNASPNGACYVNEADLQEPNWQQCYWGSKYARLLRIRKKWDPNGVFYTEATPGTENWKVIDNRLCKIR